MRLPERMFLVFAIFTALVLAACGGAPAAAPSAGVASELDRFFAERESEGFSGVVSLSVRGETRLHRAYGNAGCDGEALTTDHVFLLGSIVKVFTKAAIYSLAGDGKLALRDSIADYLDDVPPDKQAITVGMLLDHSSGLDDTIGERGEPVAYSTEWDFLPVTKAQIVERGLRSRLLYAPGTDRRYSNLGYSLLAAIIEEVSGDAYEAYVRRSVFEPLGMRHTGYVFPDWSRASMAHGCRRTEQWTSPNFAGKWMQDGPSWNLRGNGGMLGTVGDVSRWIDGLAAADFLPGPEIERFIDDVSGQSRTFSERATAFAGGNGIVNAYYLWLIDSDVRLIMISNHADHQVESYLDSIFPLLRRLLVRPASAT